MSTGQCKPILNSGADKTMTIKADQFSNFVSLKKKALEQD
jgi:hypothetical protein